MARPINHDRLDAVLTGAGFTSEQREKAHAVNEGREPESPQPRGHGAPAPKRVTTRSF